jgi:hypothetical protein
MEHKEKLERASRVSRRGGRTERKRQRTLQQCAPSDLFASLAASRSASTISSIAATITATIEIATSARARRVGIASLLTAATLCELTSLDTTRLLSPCAVLLATFEGRRCSIRPEPCCSIFALRSLRMPPLSSPDAMLSNLFWSLSQRQRKTWPRQSKQGGKDERHQDHEEARFKAWTR